MPAKFILFLTASPLMPQADYWEWQPELMGLHLWSDVLIGLAYYTISLTIVYFVQKQRDLQFGGIFLLFAALITAGGTLHLTAAWTLWHSTYWVWGVLKASTAIVSLCTAILLGLRLPQLQSSPALARKPIGDKTGERDLVTAGDHNTGEQEQTKCDYGSAAANLYQTYGQLEQRVQERTTELAAANVTLQAEIADRKRVEATLQAVTSLHQAILESANYTIISTTTDGTITTFNRTAERLLGYAAAEVVGKMSPIIIHDLDEVVQRAQTLSQELGVAIAPGFEAFVAKTKLGVPDEQKWSYIRKDGSRFPVLLSITALRDANHQITGFLGIGSDITARKQAEEALRESEERFHQAFKYAAIGMALISPGGRWLQVNRSLCEMLGYEESELLTTIFQSITHPDDLPTDLNYLHQLLANESQSYQMEKRYLHKLGAVVWVLLSVSLVRDGQGEPLYFVAQIEDISDRKQAEAELRWKETLLRSMADASPLAFMVIDHRTDGILYFNHRFCEIWGIEHLEDRLEHGELQRNDIFVHCLPLLANVPAFIESSQPLQDEVDRIVVEDELPLIDGRIIRRFSGQIRDQDDRYFGRLYLFEDITARKRSDAERRNLSNALESAVEGISQLDSQGRYITLNRAYASMVGYQPEELIGQSWHSMVYPDDLPQLLTAYQHMLNSGKVEVEARGIRKDGSLLDRQLTMVAAYDLQQQFIGHYCFMKDISDRREIERMKDEFVSVVSHELRTPLTSISGALDLLASGLLQTQPDAAQRMLTIAATNTDRLVRLINDILDIERIESGKVIMTKQTCNLADLINQSAEFMQEIAQQAGVTLTISTDKIMDAAIWVDADRIIQVITNLLSNAIKFSSPGDTVLLMAQPQDSHILIQVKDYGRGIPANKLESIFERFQQVDASDSRQKGGTGLGLAICRSILQHHGGEIWAASELGLGSTFSFTLPITLALHSQEQAEEPDQLAEPSSAPTLAYSDTPAYSDTLAPLILECDDDPCLRSVIQTMLERQGYRVLTAGSGEEAIKQAISQHPDVILLNLMMPGMDGWETLAILKQQPATQNIPIIILSGLLPDARSEVPNGVSDWIVKPPQQHVLRQALERALAKQHQAIKVLVVEDDVDLAQVLIATFHHHGIETFHAATGWQAIQLSQQVLPDLLVLDLGLPECDGFAVVDWLRQHNQLCEMPLVIYTAQDLSDRDRDRLKLSETLFLTKGRITPQDFEQRVVTLLNRMTQGDVDRH